MNRPHSNLKDDFAAVAVNSSSSSSSGSDGLTNASPLQEHMRKILSCTDRTKLMVVTDNAHTTMNMHSAHNRTQPNQRYVHRTRSSDSILWRSPMDKASMRWAASSDSSLGLISPLPMHQRLRRPRSNAVVGDAIQDTTATSAPRKPSRSPELKLSTSKAPPSSAPTPQLKKAPYDFQTSSEALSSLQRMNESILYFSPSPVPTTTRSNQANASAARFDAAFGTSATSSSLSNRLPSIAAELSSALRDTNLRDDPPLPPSSSRMSSNARMQHSQPRGQRQHQSQQPFPLPFDAMPPSPALQRHVSDSPLIIPERRSSSSFSSNAVEATSALAGENLSFDNDGDEEESSSLENSDVAESEDNVETEQTRSSSRTSGDESMPRLI